MTAKNTIISGIILAIVIGGVFLLGYFIGKRNGIIKEVPVIRPVEKNIIDTLTITNTQIKYRIKYLDSIKYDTITKIYSLDDSSSVKLFYELCSK